MLVAGNPIRADGKFAEICDQGDRDALERRLPATSCRHFNVASTESPHAHLDRSPWGMADKTWLEAVAREPGKSSPWYRSHVLAIKPKTSHETLIEESWLALAVFSQETAESCEEASAGGHLIGQVTAWLRRWRGRGEEPRSVIIVRDDAQECWKSSPTTTPRRTKRPRRSAPPGVEVASAGRGDCIRRIGEHGPRHPAGPRAALPVWAHAVLR